MSRKTPPKDEPIPTNPKTMGQYPIEKIVDVRIKHGIQYFLIKWLNYPSSQNTWEPKHHLAFLDQEVEQFYKRKQEENERKIIKELSKKKKSESCGNERKGKNVMRYYELKKEDEQRKAIKNISVEEYHRLVRVYYKMSFGFEEKDEMVKDDEYEQIRVVGVQKEIQQLELILINSKEECFKQKISQMLNIRTSFVTLPFLASFHSLIQSIYSQIHKLILTQQNRSNQEFHRQKHHYSKHIVQALLLKKDIQKEQGYKGVSQTIQSIQFKLKQKEKEKLKTNQQINSGIQRKPEMGIKNVSEQKIEKKDNQKEKEKERQRQKVKNEKQLIKMKGDLQLIKMKGEQQLIKMKGELIQKDAQLWESSSGQRGDLYYSSQQEEEEGRPRKRSKAT